MPDEKLIEDQIEETRRQMDETRASLANKLDTLHSKITETVQEATATVTSATEMVSTVKHTVEDAAHAVTDAKETFDHTVDSVKEKVGETVQSVRDTVNDTVTAVSDAFDLADHVDQHPWPMVGGAVALGFLGGCLLYPSEEEPERDRGAAASPGNGASHVAARQNGHGKKHEPRKARESSWLGDLIRPLEPELEKVKSFAIAALVNFAHDLLKPSIPEPFRPQFADIMQDVSQKLSSSETANSGSSERKKPDFSVESRRFAG